ncbi:uncharacterized membrane-anchored protein YitT (DUF2179 family) [Pullulanibacillus pueri]|uniref:UPF0750 membrane protein YitE n=1 Tax=Pullulanibacillus pueri TaxID=1437324 RepID=A0A8J2ZUU2_9BACL|nr:YitT family protein [Pullulanibacillus pueri]MBM7681409.1 uncharacterized membrane-anchored protein YitT (DUF2179 family) [Pullulanibacillus pueri]GGH78762.1 UPF0750 membrane protein YitE [Pullulanibacillus pueri]
MLKITALMNFSRYGILISGAMLQGVAMALFLFPHHIPSGGAAGLAIIFNQLFHLSHSWSLWLVNFTFLIFAIYWFGLAWTVRTMFAVTITSITIHVLNSTLVIHTHPLIIDLLFGAILFGLGVGLLIKHGASSGGMLIPALMISNTRHFPPGKTMFWINLSIFVITACIIDWRIVIFAIICQWISSHIIDLNNA